MKIYFNMKKYESHKFTKINESVLVLSVSLKNGVWVAFTERIVNNELKTGLLIDSETGKETDGNYYDCFFFKKTFLRILFKPYTLWSNSSIIITKMPGDRYNNLTKRTK